MKFWVTLITFTASTVMVGSLLAWFGLAYQPLGSVPTDGARVYEREGLIIGQVIAQGRSNHEGISVSFFHLDEAREVAHVSTPPSGDFLVFLPSGRIDIRFFLPGYLAESRRVDVGPGEEFDLGQVKLRGGDADGNDRIDANDLRRLGGGDGSPEIVLDINGDGLRNVFDLALAGLNLGRGGEAPCPIPTAGDPDGPVVMDVQTMLHEGNNLIIDFDVLLNRPASIYVEYQNPEAGSFRSMPTDGVAAQQNTSIVRLRPLTTYCYEVFGVDDQGGRSAGFQGTFLTGPLPTGLRESFFDVTQGQQTYGMTLMESNSSGFSGFVAIDSQANVVWYFESVDGRMGTLSQDISNWNLVYELGRTVREITPLGALVAESPDVFCEPTPDTLNRDGVHHEVLTPVDGDVLYIGRVLKQVTIDGEARLQQGDTIRQWNQASGEDIEVWDPFLFLDPVNDRTAVSNTSAERFWAGCDGSVANDDWTHANSLQVVPSGNDRQGEDGNVIMSLRHLNQIISISPDPFYGLIGEGTELAWRLGDAQQLGIPTSNFSFPDSSDRFYHQHSARQLPNGNILLFDNGNLRPDEEGGLYSRALELELDFDTMEARKVWEYRHNPDLFAGCCSNVVRLDNGNTVLVFGSAFGVDVCCRVFTVVEADIDGNAVAVIELGSPGKSIQYRVYPIASLYGESELD